MNLTIKLLRPFSEAIGKNELAVDFKGNTLEELLKNLVNKYPKLKKELYSNTGELTEYICLFINDKPISALNGIKTKLNNNDKLLFFMPVSGG